MHVASSILIGWMMVGIFASMYLTEKPSLQSQIVHSWFGTFRAFGLIRLTFVALPHSFVLGLIPDRRVWVQLSLSNAHTTHTHNLNTIENFLSQDPGISTEPGRRQGSWHTDPHQGKDHHH